MPTRGTFERTGVVLTVASIVVVFLINLVELADFDIFMHLAVGDWILDHLTVPRTGLFSATRGDEPWVDNEWGFQVLASMAHRVDGVRGLVLLSAVLPTLAAVLVAATLRRRGMPWSAVALGIGLFAVALGPVNLRPQLVTYFFLAAFLWGTAELVDERSRLPVVVLPLLTFFWANLHGGFILGLTVIAIPLAVEAARRLTGRVGATPLRPLLTTLILSSFAVFVNPYGWRQFAYPIQYALRPGMTAFNLEWQPTVLAERPQLALLLAVAVIVFALSPRRPELGDLATALAFSAFAMKANRHAGFASIVLPCVVAPAAAALAHASLGSGSKFRRTVFSLGVGAFLVSGLFWVRDLPFRSPFHFDRSILLPVQSADFLSQHRPPGGLFNQYGWGGFLIYRFRPEAIVFVDGRNDLYGEAFMAEYMRIMAGEPGAVETLERYGIGTALLAYHPNNGRLIRALLDAGWTCIDQSADFIPVIVLVRPTEEARGLIEALGRPLAPP